MFALSFSLLFLFTLCLAIGAVKTAALLRVTSEERDRLRLQLEAQQKQSLFWHDTACSLRRYLKSLHVAPPQLPPAPPAAPFVDDPDWWKKGGRFHGRNGSN